MRPKLILLVLLLLPALIAAAPGPAGPFGSATEIGPTAPGPPAALRDAADPWASESTATVHPGVRTYTGGLQCTANFVFEQIIEINNKPVRELYLGQAAHCASLDDSTSTNGCEAEIRSPGTSVEIDGASQYGTLAYSSWWTMQQTNETNSDRCLYNDFALVKLHPADHGKVNPTVPVWGGPAGVGGATDSGENVYTYGRSWLRFGIQSDREGLSLGTSANNWVHRVYTASPGIPGDSGSAFLDEHGDAMGVLSTIGAVPPASNGVSDLRMALNYMKAKTNAWDRLQLAVGTRGFEPGVIP